MEWNEETKKVLTDWMALCQNLRPPGECPYCAATESALAHIETLEKLVNQAAEQIRDVTAQQSVSDASFDLAGKAVVSLRERIAVLETEKAAAVLALGESQANGLRYYAKIWQGKTGRRYAHGLEDSVAACEAIEVIPPGVEVGIAEVRMLPSVPPPVSEKADLVQRINKYLFCAKEQGGSAVLLKEAKALLEKGETKSEK